MKVCCDCDVTLTDENRSRHQPTIRCLKCFDDFAVRMTQTLRDMARALAPKEKLNGKA